MACFLPAIDQRRPPGGDRGRKQGFVRPFRDNGRQVESGRIMSTDDEEAVISANRSLYRAFAAGDLAAMDALWAREKPVACIHPGGPVLESRAIILDSWAAIMVSPDRPSIQPQRVRVFLLGDIA